MTPSRTLCALVAALTLAGCASVAPDGLRGQVQQHTQGRLPAHAQLPAGDVHTQATASGAQADQAHIAQWLAQPLDADTAVRIALLNNPGLQTQLAQLAAQDAERAQSLTLINPSLTLGRFTSGQTRELERQLGFNVVNLITLPWRARWHGWRMEQASLTTAQAVLQLAANTRRSWLRAVAAEQLLGAQTRMHDAATLSAELARRAARVGNLGTVQQARELRSQHDAAAQLARARLAASLAREDLARQLGLWGQAAADLTLPAQLPPLPPLADLRGGDDAEATALRERLDLRALRRALDTTADQSGWAGVGAVFGDMGVSHTHTGTTERATGHGDTTRGWALNLPLPLLDWGGSARAGARAELQRSAAQLREAAIGARSDARTNWLRYRTAWDLAHQQQSEVLPLATRLQDDAVLRYNGMFISVWDLLAQARETTQAVATATEAQRDFWLAEVDLQLALTGTSLGSMPPSSRIEQRKLVDTPHGADSSATSNPSPQGH